MASTTFVVTHSVSSDYQGKASMRAREAAKRAANFIDGARLGTYSASKLDVSSAVATGTLTLSGASGTVGGVINGTTVTVTASGGDTATATAIAAAINASSSALVNKHVTASASGAVVTLTAKASGHSGNAITLAASGTGVTASGARLTGGAATTYTF